jgi:hypothetical protein
MTLSLVIEPVISIRLTEMGMQKSKTGLAFGLQGASQTLAALFLSWLGKRIPIHYTHTISMLTLISALLMLGPSKIILVLLPEEIPVLLAGCSLMGISVALLITLQLVEICDSESDQMIIRWTKQCYDKGLSFNQTELELKTKWRQASPLLSDRVAAIEGICFSLGSLIGPMLGGKLTDHFGY